MTTYNEELTEKIIEEAIIELGKKSTAPDKETPDWMKSDIRRGIYWVLTKLSLAELFCSIDEQQCQQECKHKSDRSSCIFTSYRIKQTPTPPAASGKQSDDGTFKEYLSNTRDEFVKEINAQEWNIKLRTTAEDLLIAFDQLRDKYTTQSNPSVENLQKLIDYFSQQLSMQVKGEIKYSGSEAYEDAMEVCQNLLKSLNQK